MYPTLRNIHLILALLSLPLVLLYAVSSIQMTHAKWFPWKPQISETQVTLASGGADARALARELMDRHGVRGELQQVFTTPASLKFSLVRPGTVYQVEYDNATGIAKIRTFTAGFTGMLNRLHHAAGFWHGYLLSNVWSGFVVWASVAIILLGISGVWVWFARHQDRVVGAILLGANLVMSVTILYLIRR